MFGGSYNSAIVVDCFLRSVRHEYVMITVPESGELHEQEEPGVNLWPTVLRIFITTDYKGMYTFLVVGGGGVLNSISCYDDKKTVYVTPTSSISAADQTAGSPILETGHAAGVPAFNYSTTGIHLVYPRNEIQLYHTGGPIRTSALPIHEANQVPECRHKEVFPMDSPRGLEGFFDGPMIREPSNLIQKDKRKSEKRGRNKISVQQLGIGNEWQRAAPTSHL
ncbi:hypothetical protein BJ742DRAFT_741471 [Cladochytrium replicatum]|nr:hypothetical protein BJ742DRAFT_741471 [Cladochytrium replicatum]